MPARPKLHGDRDRLMPASLRTAVLEHCDAGDVLGWVRIAILLADQAGLRATEIVRLKVADCRLGRAPYDLLIRGAKHRKTDHVDAQPIGEELRDQLAAWLASGPTEPTDSVLRLADATYSRQHLWRSVMKVHADCQVPEIYNVHSWRHGYGTRIYQQTKDLVLTQRMLRHRSTKPTERYVHMSEGDERIGNVLAAIGTGKPKKKSKPKKKAKAAKKAKKKRKKR